MERKRHEVPIEQVGFRRKLLEEVQRFPSSDRSSSIMELVPGADQNRDIDI